MKLFYLPFVLSFFFLVACKDDEQDFIVNNYYYYTNSDSIIGRNSSFDSTTAHIQIDEENISESPFYENPYDKLWAHRINTIEEINPAFQKFSGVELDIYYEKSENRFDIRHHGGISGLSLRNYFKSIKNPYYYYYWLDFKNLGITNHEESYELLYEILLEFDLLNNVIVEGTNPVSLGYYANRGVFTSYWIPMVNDIYSNSNSQQASEVKYWLNQYPFTVISADYRMYPYIKKYFPSQNMHLWVKSADVPNGDNEAKKISANLAKDPYVKVILVTIEENFLL